MLLDDGLEVRRKTCRPGGGGSAAGIEKVGQDGRRELQFGDDVGEDVVGVSKFHDEAANHTVESILAVNENLDGRNPKSGGEVHEATNAMVGQIAAIAFDSCKLIVIEKVVGEVNRFGPQRSLQKLAKQITEKDGPE